jgi:protein-S-isoprenylcysteine O-methyltransferase Ste14
MSLTLRNVLLNLVYYGLTVVLFPWTLLSLDTYFGFVRHPSTALRIGSVLLGVAGAALQFWSIFVFQSIGRGTPSPALAPKKLVTKGPYKWVRNPMNIGELMVFLALGGWFGSPLLLGYTVVAALAFHSFIVVCEEPQHLSRFGKEYIRYRASVNRWLPRLASKASASRVKQKAV